MKKIKTNLHALNKHIFLGFSFCVFALIVSVYWGLTYAEDTTLLSTNPPLSSTTDPLASTSGTVTTSGSTSGSTYQTTTTSIPAAPSGLMVYGTLSSTYNNIPLKWTDNSTNEDKWNVERRITGTSTWVFLNQIMSPNVVSYIDSTVTVGTSYDYRVQACLSGTGCSEYATLDNVMIPAPTVTTTPTNQCTELKLTLTDNKTSYYIGDNVNYTWTCTPASTYSYVSVFLQKPDGSISNLNNTTGTTTTMSNGFNTSNFTAGSYVLKACLSTSCSPSYPYSTQVFYVTARATTDTSSGGTSNGGTVTTVPSAPSLLSLAQALTSTSKYISLKWTDNSNNEDKWNVERKVTSTSTWSSLYQIIGSNITSYSDITAVPGISYDYRVQACLSGTGCSAYTTMEKIIIPLPTENPGVVTAPVAPSSLVKEIIYSSGKPSVKLTWKDNSTNETKFVIRRKLSSDTSYGTFIRNVYPNVIYYLDSDYILPGLSYDYSLAACASDTVCSSVIEIKNILIPQAISSDTTVKENLLIPIAPTGLSLPAGTILSETSKFIPLKWTDNSTNEDKWNIERRINGGTWMYLNQITSANVTYYADYSAIPGNVYDYRVQACLSGTGCSNSALLEKVTIPLPKIIAPVVTPIIAPSDSTNTITNTNTETEKTEEVVTADKNTTENSLVTSVPTGPAVTEALPITNKEIAETISVISQSPVINESVKTEIANTEETSKVVKLVYQDTNKDGISDYESKYVYNIDPVKKSPTSVYEGKTITAADKILLGFDPSKKELVKVVKQEPIASTAPIVNTYKVNKVELVKGQNKVVLKGQALPNSFITLYVYSTPIIVTVKTDSRGEWQYLLDKELEDGTHTVYTATVNNTGNIVAQSSPYSFTKTAEAASLKDIPVAGASVGVEKPDFLGTKNIFIITIGIVLITGIILILIGLFTKKAVPNGSN